MNLPKQREQNQFKKYQIEQHHRTKWISENFTKFKKYMTDSELKSLSIDFNQPISFFPIVVTNRVVTTEDSIEVPLVTFTELKDSITKEWVVNIEGKNGTSDIESSGRVFRFPCFVKSISP